MSNRITLKAAWDEFRGQLLSHASATQVIDMRRAFYAGADRMRTCAWSGLGQDAEADLAWLGKIDKELREFADQVKAGVS